MTLQIPDPRHFADGTAAGSFRPPEPRTLSRLLESGGDAEIAAALRAAPTQAAYRSLWDSVCDAANHAGAERSDTGVVARVFALPLVIITGSRRPASVPGVVPDIAAITALFEQHGALGPTRNFGLGNALCSLETIESIRPGEIYAWTRDAGATRRELPPSVIEIMEPGEQVHLRFLVGAGIAPAAEPSFVETASNIGVWGMPLTRALAAQLAQPDVEVLPLARPPQDVLRAAHAGRYAQLDAAFNLFVSNAVRRQRSATGDPVAVISAHDDGEVRISLASQFDDTLVDGFRWPLHPLDGMADIMNSITGLLAECRIGNVHCVDQVLPAVDAQGKIRYPRLSDIRPPTRH
ncbi:MAG: hypothetical protein ABI547_04125 [Betaproteobacteria bacterium]